MTTRCLGISALLILVGLSLSTACSRRHWGLPRTEASAVSPDGHYRAFVRNHVSLDPPRQSLWLARTAGRTQRIAVLSEDQDWCHVIVWARDSQSVAFLVQDGRLIVIDAATGRTRVDRWLVPRDGYPSSQAVTNVSLSPDGSVVRFSVCARGTDTCTEQVQQLTDVHGTN